MKIAIVGASGTLGKAIVAELKPRHEIVAVGRNSGDFHADQRDIKSLQFAFKHIGKVDAIICAEGGTPSLFGLVDRGSSRGDCEPGATYDLAASV
jgi:putative NADH-flavin reductase